MLNGDATRERTSEVAHELFERRRPSKPILGEELEEFLGSGSQPGPGELPGVLLSLLRENDPARRYQPGFSEHFEIGVRIPLWIDSRIPGIWSR